jgi:hypothetical protein
VGGCPQNGCAIVGIAAQDEGGIACLDDDAGPISDHTDHVRYDGVRVARFRRPALELARTAA